MAMRLGTKGGFAEKAERDGPLRENGKKRTSERRLGSDLNIYPGGAADTASGDWPASRAVAQEWLCRGVMEWVTVSAVLNFTAGTRT